MPSISDITRNLISSDFVIKSEGTYIKNVNDTPSLLLVWADFCGHCHRFIPTFQEFNKTLNKNGDTFLCLAIENGDVSSELSSALSIQGFPTLFWVDQHGKIVGEHSKGRDLPAILQTACDVYHHCVQEH